MRELGRRTFGVLVEFSGPIAVAYAGVKAATQKVRVLTQTMRAWRPFLKRPAASNGTLNIGAGNRPVSGAFNIDINPRVTGVHRGNGTNMPNVRTGSQSRIIIEHPQFDVFNSEVRRVLQPGGRIEITGSYANRYFTTALNQLDDLGFRRVGTRIDVPNNGQFTNNLGQPLLGTFFKYILEVAN